MATPTNHQFINGYDVPQLITENSGFSKWGFATKYGREYFFKELVTPVYPTDRSVMSDEVFEQKRAECAEFENRFRRFYTAINNASCGNLIRINEFFRSGNRYYLVTEKISGGAVPVEVISTLPADKKLLLLKTVANCFHKLHGAGIVHFDVKPTNILLKRSAYGNYTAKLIDFDAGFFLGEVIENEELGHDPTYLAPETLRGICGEDVSINEKSDIFALGLVFHQYCYAKLPSFDKSEYEYPFEAVLDGKTLGVSRGAVPDSVSDIIEAMLDVEPENRPSAADIFNKISEITGVNNVIAVNKINANNMGTGGGTSSRFKGSLSMHTGSSIGAGSIYPAATAATTYAKEDPVVKESAAPWFTSAGDL